MKDTMAKVVGRFEIERAVYVEREDDKDTTFEMPLTFPTSTIDDLFKWFIAGNKAYKCSNLPQTTKTL